MLLEFVVSYQNDTYYDKYPCFQCIHPDNIFIIVTDVIDPGISEDNDQDEVDSKN